MLRMAQLPMQFYPAGQGTSVTVFAYHIPPYTAGLIAHHYQHPLPYCPPLTTVGE